MYLNKKYSLYMTIITILLVAFGIFMVYSASNVWALAKYNDS